MSYLGPVPTLFSDKPEETLAHLQNTPEFAFQCLQALVSRLYERGELSRRVLKMFKISHFRKLRKKVGTKYGKANGITINEKRIGLPKFQYVKYPSSK